MVGVQFTLIGGNELTTDNILPENLTSSLDKLRIWNGNSYIEMFYWDENDGILVYDDDEKDWVLGVSGFGDNEQYAFNEPLYLGTSFWANCRDAKATITVFGEVSYTNMVSVKSRLSMIANPLPVNVMLKDVIADGLVSSIDKIRYWTPSGYEEIFYWDTNDGLLVYDDESKDWVLSDTGGFGDNEQYASDVIVPVGKGFWLESRNSNAELTFPSITK